MAALAPSHPARRLLEDRQRRGDRRVCGVADLVGHLRVAEREQQRHRLRRAERHIERGDGRHRVRSSEPVGAARVDVGEQVRQRFGVDLALEPQLSGGSADPLTRCLLGAGVVLLGAASDGVDVVLLLAVRQLPEAQHGPTAHSARRRTIRHSTAGASASSFLGLGCGNGSGNITGAVSR